MLTDQQIVAKYGKPGDESQLTTIVLPYPVRIAWDKSVTVKSIRCHSLVASSLYNVFKECLAHYGFAKIQELGIDLFAGCVSVRTMRGSKTKWSRHAWGIAIDLDPERNGLKTKWKDAQFSKPEYQFMVDAFYRNGFMSYGKERDFDAMHFEIRS